MADEVRCLRIVGFLMCVLSSVAVGLGVADVTLEYSTCSSSNKCGTLTIALAFAWVAVGIWAALPIFITGVATFWYSNRLTASKTKGWFGWLCFLSFVVFAPALIIISALQLSYTFKDTGVPQTSSTDQARFAIPLCIAIIGFILWIHILIVLNYVCRGVTQKLETHRTDMHVNIELEQQQRPTPTGWRHQKPTAAADVTADDQADLDRMNMWSAYRWLNNGGNSGCSPYSRPAAGCGGCGQRQQQQPGASYYHIGQAPVRFAQIGPGASRCGAGGGVCNMPRCY